MNAFRAVALSEGFEEGSSEETLEVWQFLVDTGLAWRLQGAFGRHAQHLIDAGLIEPATRNTRD